MNSRSTRWHIVDGALAGILFFSMLVPLFGLNLGYIFLVRGIRRNQSPQVTVVSYTPPGFGNRSDLLAAQLVFEQVLRLRPGDCNALLGLGQALIWQGNYLGAVKLLEASETKCRGVDNYEDLLGNTLMFTGSHARALEAWISSRQDPESLYYLALSLYNQSVSSGQNQQGVADAKGILNQVIGSPQSTPKTLAKATALLASLYDGSGSTDEAVRTLQIYLNRFPQDGYIRSILAWELLKQNKLDQAFEQAQHSVEAMPNWRGHYVMGSIYLNRCSLVEAVKELQQGLNFQLTDYRYYDLYLMLGNAYWELGRAQDAISEWEKFSLFEPGNKYVRDLLSQVKNNELDQSCSK